MAADRQLEPRSPDTAESSAPSPAVGSKSQSSAWTVGLLTCKRPGRIPLSSSAAALGNHHFSNQSGFPEMLQKPRETLVTAACVCALSHRKADYSRWEAHIPQNTEQLRKQAATLEVGA